MTSLRSMHVVVLREEWAGLRFIFGGLNETPNLGRPLFVAASDIWAPLGFSLAALFESQQVWSWSISTMHPRLPLKYLLCWGFGKHLG